MKKLDPTSPPSYWLRATLFLLLPLVLLAACDTRKASQLPPQVLGFYTTDEARFQGHYLQIEAGQLTFGSGTVALDKPERVREVRFSPRNNPTDFRINLFASDGSDDFIALQFSPGNGELRIKSQPKTIWRRRPINTGDAPIKQSTKNTTNTPIAVPPELFPLPESLHPNCPAGRKPEIYKIDCVHPEICCSY